MLMLTTAVKILKLSSDTRLLRWRKPRCEAGYSGKDGKDGKIGINGKDGVTTNISVTRDGKPGVDGAAGTTINAH